VSLEVDVVSERPQAILSARGEVDLASVAALRGSLDGVDDDGVSIVVIDLSDVGFIDSSGLRVLAQSHRRLLDRDGNPRLRIVVASEPVARVFDVSGLRSFFDVYDTRADAVRGR
jgi:anti-sigma B factor antagonist